MSEFESLPRDSRAKRLKAETHEAHERLDNRIMAARPFADRERYGLFLAFQNAFHRDIDALYADAELRALVPDLAERRRLDLIAQDQIDLGDILGAEPGGARTAPVFAPGGAVDPAAALGWLYVAEGSNLGAAFLLKEAAKLGLSEEFGARHLAAHPQGRGLHWRRFVESLDGAVLSETEEARVVDGARSAFRRAHALVDQLFA